MKWCLWGCFVLLMLHTVRVKSDRPKSTNKGSSEFRLPSIVRPQLINRREKREISSTKDTVEGGHIHYVSLTYEVNGKNYILDLQLYRDLIPDSYFEEYQFNGKHVINKPTGKDIEMCHYHGKLRGIPNSWAAISTCNGISGVVYDGKEVHYLEQGSSKNVGTHLHHDLDIISSKNCDHIEVPSLHTEGNGTKRRLYAPLNIFIALVGVIVWTERDEIDFSNNGDLTLTKFLHYRRNKLNYDYPNDNAFLLTLHHFEGGIIGKALKGPICTSEFSGGFIVVPNESDVSVAYSLAHAMGHNLGMEHDTPECKCPSETCIMSSSKTQQVKGIPNEWSSCSLEYLDLAFERGMDYCLRNKPKSLFQGPVCGNGFVEAGEQCDCGLEESCDNPCCNATTCMLYANAFCATGECCDLQTCQLKHDGSICRSADHECDFPEYCTGLSEYCPDDVYKMDGEECQGGEAFCYQGSCRTHSDQCRLLWGSSGKSSSIQCYSLNVKGTRHGNCGYHRFNQSYEKCTQTDSYCGLLHCKHLNERLEFGMESVAVLSHSFINFEGNILPCRSAIIDLGNSDMDPGLVPNGAKCGENKMCLNQHCVDVSSVRQCPGNCSGNGVCDNHGHCHCDPGYAPPFCNASSTGGHKNNGPVPPPCYHNLEEDQHYGSTHIAEGIKKVFNEDLHEVIEEFKSDVDVAVKKLLNKLEQKLLMMFSNNNQ